MKTIYLVVCLVFADAPNFCNKFKMPDENTCLESLIGLHQEVRSLEGQQRATEAGIISHHVYCIRDNSEEFGA